MLKKIFDFFRSDKSRYVDAILTMNDAIKDRDKTIASLNNEIVVILGSIALANNGTYVLGSEFIKTMQEDLSLMPNLKSVENGVEITVEKVFND